MNNQPLRDVPPQAGALLKTLGNENRLKILCQLSDGEKTVGQLADAIGLNQSPLSQHLARLRKLGLVKTRRDAQTVFYSLDGDVAEKMLDAVADVCGAHTPRPPRKNRQ